MRAGRRWIDWLLPVDKSMCPGWSTRFAAVQLQLGRMTAASFPGQASLAGQKGAPSPVLTENPRGANKQENDQR